MCRAVCCRIPSSRRPPTSPEPMSALPRSEARSRFISWRGCEDCVCLGVIFHCLPHLYCMYTYVICMQYVNGPESHCVSGRGGLTRVNRTKAIGERWVYLCGSSNHALFIAHLFRVRVCVRICVCLFGNVYGCVCLCVCVWCVCLYV